MLKALGSLAVPIVALIIMGIIIFGISRIFLFAPGWPYGAVIAGIVIAFLIAGIATALDRKNPGTAGH